MANIVEHNISNLVQFLSLVETIRDSPSQALWFRGVGDSKHGLVPSLYRHVKSKSIEEYIAIEESVIQTFQQRSIPFLERDVDKAWDWLFLMQHYGVPTRLLGYCQSWWTDNPSGFRPMLLNPLRGLRL
jgi:hypothetical protein